MNSKLPNLFKPVQISHFVSFKEPSAGLWLQGFISKISMTNFYPQIMVFVFKVKKRRLDILKNR